MRQASCRGQPARAIERNGKLAWRSGSRAYRVKQVRTLFRYLAFRTSRESLASSTPMQTMENRLKIAVLDDYLHRSQKSADWSKLESAPVWTCTTRNRWRTITPSEPCRMSC
jgi:hypothetical protein